MKTITTHEAKTHLSRYLAAIEQGEEFVIARGKKPIALLTPFSKVPSKPRPKVGETLDAPFPVNAAALAPLTEDEMREWTG